jgi:hypothetical protein
MTKNNTPLVSAAELDALIAGWSTQSNREVDVYFPLRAWFLILVCLTFATGLMLKSPQMSIFLTSDPEMAKRLMPFLYFRGWFVVGVLTIGLYAYLKNWYPSLMFSILTVIGCVNFVSDMFIIYPERLANPTASFTFLLMFRLLGLVFIFLCAKNSGRMPDPADRLNLLLPLKNSRSDNTPV